MNVTDLMHKAIGDRPISKAEALFLYEAPLKLLLESANEIRKKTMGPFFDLCGITNAKSGKCSEDCTYCAQSAHYDCPILSYPFRDLEEIKKEALMNEKDGVWRFSMVTAGKNLKGADLEKALYIYKALSKEDIYLCASHGLLSKEELRQLKQSGVSRYHNNLETSARFFPSICTTHSYQDKIKVIQAAKEVGLALCSGGILGLGEGRSDRIDLALTLRALHILSVPLNILSPIPGTPLARQAPLTEEEILRTVAVFRFILPHSVLRLAGGRGGLQDKGKKAFLAGANGCITGKMLTTLGIDVTADLKMIQELGFEVKTHD